MRYHIDPKRWLSLIYSLLKYTLLCIADYFSKFPLVKKTDGLLADNLIIVVKIVFAEFGLPSKIVSDGDTNLVSDKFRQFFMQLNLEQAITLSYLHSSNG